MLSALLASALHPAEVAAMLKLKLNSGVKYQRTQEPLSELGHLEPREYTYQALVKTSRSFAVVIQLLPEALADAVAV
ncbi:MAG: hypothetical protein MHM6MM_006674, partial [Cercozoa sp. M6MM]